MYRRNLSLMYITQFFHSLIFTIPIWIVYYQSRISVIEISLLVTIQYITQVVMELPSGALADLIGRKKTIMTGFVLGAGSMFFFPFASHFSHFLIIAILDGTADSFRSGSEEAILYDTHKQSHHLKDFDKSLANANIIYQIGLAIATAIGGFLYQIHIFLPYILYAISLTLGFIAAAFYIEPTIDSQKFTFKGYLHQMRDGTKEAFKHTYASTLSLFYILVGGISWSSTLYFNGYLNIHLVPSDSLRGLIVAAMRLINVIVISAALKNSKLFNWKRTILFFPITMLLAYLPGFALNGFAGLPFIQLSMAAGTARWIILAAKTNEVFSSKYRATAISALSLFIGIVYISLTSISGVIIQHFGIGIMYTLLGVVTLTTVVPISIKLLKIDHQKYIIPAT